MSLEKIISIPGMGGLFKMVAQMRNGGFVVESLSDQRRFPVASSQRIVMLEDISVYTVDGDMPLKEVLLKMKDQDAICSKVDVKAEPEHLKSTLKKIIPDFDEERVHASDIRKMFAWYGLLKDIVTEEPETEKDGKKSAAEASPNEDEVKESAPKKTKKAKPAADNEPAVKPKKKKETTEEKPAAKKTAKKKTEN